MQSLGKYRTMRHMSTPRANGRIIRLVVALVIGVAATSISAYWPLYMVERGGGARITTVYRGLYGWWNARDSVIGLHWSNLQLLENPLNARSSRASLRRGRSRHRRPIRRPNFSASARFPQGGRAP